MDPFTQYGSSISEVVLEYPHKIFQCSYCTGIIPYRLENNCAIVFGEPLSPQEEIPELTAAFHKFCQESNYNVIYLIVSEKFARWALNNHCKILIQPCVEFIFDPTDDPALNHKKLRWRLEKGRKQGITVHEYIPHDPEIEAVLTEIGLKWKKVIKGPHVYLGELKFFDDYEGKRWFYSKEGERITGMIMLSRLEEHKGWFLRYLTFSPDAFQYTSEFLMDSVLKILNNENCRYLTKGVLAADSIGEVNGLNPFAEWILRKTYTFFNWFFDFENRKEYWLKFDPTVKPTYILFSNPIGPKEIKSLLKVFRNSK